MKIVYSRKEKLRNIEKIVCKIGRWTSSLIRAKREKCREYSRYIVVSAVYIRVKYLASAELAVPIFRDITQQGENTTGPLSI